MAQNIIYSPWERTKGPCLCLMIISLLFSLLRWFSSVAAFLMSLIKLTIWIVSHRHKAGRGQPAAGGGGGHGPYGPAPFYEMWQLYPNRVVCSCSCSVISCFYAHTWNSGFLSVCIYVVWNFFDQFVRHAEHPWPQMLHPLSVEAWSQHWTSRKVPAVPYRHWRQHVTPAYLCLYCCLPSGNVFYLFLQNNSIPNYLECGVEGRSLRNSKHWGLDNVSDAAASHKWDGDN